MAIADRKFKGGERLVSTGKKYAGRTVDVVKTKDGLIVAKKISSHECHKKYG